ncbi:MAG: glycosyltransferase [Eubacteriales bacterium]|nr:glycosyltransferase [Eubacteriales bacterium]
MRGGGYNNNLYPLKLCTFSRVMREKGIEDAINAIIEINESLGYTAFCLDIYGQVWDEYKERFDCIQKDFPDYVHYCGAVNADRSVEVLKTYFALLFPTYYEGEGFAGTLIDAYSAGVPVIATDWRYNSELVTDRTGFTYPTGNQKAFIEILTKVAVNPSLVLRKKKNCFEEANKFRIDKAIQVLIRELESE